MIENIDNNQLPEEPKEPRKIFSTMQPATAAFIALVGIFITYQIGGAILTLLIFGLNFDKADVNQMRLLTMGGQIMLMLLPTLLFARYVYPAHITQILRVKFPKPKEIGIFIAGLILLTPLLQSYLFLQNYFLDKAADLFPILRKLTNVLDQLDKMVEQTYGELLKATSVFEASFVIFVVAIIPALCEEILFRGLVQKSFEQKFKPYFSIFITSLFFGLYHFNPYGLVALVALGFYFGFAAYKSDSIFIPMILHFINNFLAVIAFLVLGSDELMSTNIKHDGLILPQIFVFLITLALFIGFIFFVTKNYTKFSKPKEESL
ncbi:MAG: CPBP family intramembrane glutamic endopeptidase [Melioribacteraceae bacterium]